jgi:hypothetical protein
MIEKKIKSWAIIVNYSDNDEDTKTISDIPNEIAQTIDDFLTKYEKNNNAQTTQTSRKSS